MRRFGPMALALVLLAAGCGDDDTASTTSAPAATTTTAAPASTTTGAPATTTTEAPATTVVDDGTAARVAAAQALEGEYEGEWNNTTFGSTGPVTASIVVDPDAALATFTLDLGGNVFGAADPDPFTVEIDLSQEGPYQFTTELMGDGEFTMTDGIILFTAFSIDQLTGASMEVEGTVNASGWDLFYTILNPAGSTFAEGTVEATAVG
ncbi:MAG: hypothetical protein WEE36_00550 [Acidimicrobiia bacterium]